MRKLVFGVGINDSNYTIYPSVNGTQTCCPFYRAWHSMIRRAYSEVTHGRQPAYIGVTVCKKWHSFMAFREWMINQDWQGKQLDKDLLVFGNKEYSPEACMFVSSHANKIMSSCLSLRGEFPIGVCWSEIKHKFFSQCHIGNKNKYLGLFDSSVEAHRAWQLCKIKAINSYALIEKDAMVISALNGYAIKIRIDYDLGIETK